MLPTFTPRNVVITVLFVLAIGTGGVLAGDFDGDGLSTHSELSSGLVPLDSDTDGDGLRDDSERTFGSNPTVADTDGDGLNDGREYRGGTVGNERRGWKWDKSDPRNVDTDGDGIKDGTEFDRSMDPTNPDSDQDGIDDTTEVEGPTDPVDPDTDGDTLLDGWEVNERSEKGAPLPDADPLHKDMYVQVTYLRGVDHRIPWGVFSDSEEWFAEMPVRNPDGETGITVRFYDEDDYSGPIDQSIDEWTKSNGAKTVGVSGFMAMREFYNREYMGPRTGSYFLVVVPNEDVPVRGSGNAGGSKTTIVTPWKGFERDDEKRKAHTITHELLHNIVRKVGTNDCNGRMHTCEGFLSYENDYYLSERSAQKLNTEGFARPVYREQMNATSCEDTISDPSECGA